MLRIYKASAGSGKTYTLVKEFLRIALKEPDKFRHILAITFTNKAAAEMKERIIGNLGKLSKDHKDTRQLAEDLSGETGLSKDELQEKTAHMLRNMLHHYADLHVSTIDSFVHRVIRAFAHDLSLSMNFDIEMDRDKLLAEVIEMLMDRLHDEDDQVTNAVVDYAESNIEEGKSWNIEYALMALGRELFNEEAIPHLAELNKYDLNEVKQVRSALHAYVNSFEQGMFGEGKKAYELILQAGLTAKSFYQGDRGIFGFFRKYAEETFPNDVEGNTYVVKTVAEDKWAAGKLSTGELASLEGIKEQLLQHYENMVRHNRSAGGDYQLAQLLLQRFYAFILLTDIQKLMEEYKKENNLLHISEFQQRVHAIVREQDAPVIYERIGDWFDSILIDEHQDTSVLQWQNLLPLVENSQFKTEDSLVVGDGKQAIYRFRNGKVEQFAMLPKIYGSDEDARLKEREVAINNYGVDNRNLEFNYRSRKNIIEFNNELYEVLATAPELLNKSIYEGASQLPTEKTEEGGYAQLEFLPEPDEGQTHEEQFCKRVEELIADARNRGYDFKDIAVLTRSNVFGSAIAAYLIQKGIRVISSESLLIDRSPKVRLLLSTLNYFDQKLNHIARAEIAYYINALKAGTGPDFGKRDFRCTEEEFELQISELIGKPFRSYDFLSFHITEMVQQLAAFYGLSTTDPFLQFFMDEVMSFAANRRSNIREFLDWWGEVRRNKSIIYPDTLDAVRIMTIHKSKGLEFPVVILAEADFAVKTTRKHFWVNLHKPWLKELHLGILPVNKKLEETEFAPLYEQEVASSFLDVLNVIYVATTRAADMLYILSSRLKNMPKDNNSVTVLWLYFLQQTNRWEEWKTYSFGDPATRKTKPEKPTSYKLYEVTEAPDTEKKLREMAIRKTSQQVWGTGVQEKINWGNVVHTALSRVHYAADIPRVVRRMLADGMLSEEEAKRLTEKLEAIVQHPQLSDYYSANYKAINERRIITEYGLRIPDRVVLKDKEAVIIDYKTGEAMPEHATQLRDYSKALNALGLQTVKRLLVYTETKMVEEV